jgi:asparagine synthetase B (glutamine-hydrolysing)
MRCVAEGALNEVEYAKRFADINKLDLKVVDITWEDIERIIPICIKSCKMPFHSIQPLIYRVCEDAKKDHLTQLVCGETADCRFGGLDGLLSKDYTLKEFCERFTFLEPEKILKKSVDILDDFLPYVEQNGITNAHKFCNEYFSLDLNDYLNASKLNNIELIMPYAYMDLAEELDLERIRRGENKYLIRELFAKRYKNITPNKKLPMPRAVGIWLKDWKGPKRSEFKNFDINELKPDQKWLVYILEVFLNMLDNGELYD